MQRTYSIHHPIQLIGLNTDLLHINNDSALYYIRPLKWSLYKSAFTPFIRITHFYPYLDLSYKNRLRLYQTLPLELQ